MLGGNGHCNPHARDERRLRRSAGRSPGVRPGRAFTLIELLVVIAIISLLISILLPSLSRARDQAKGVHCLARLKEFGNALAAYENVSDGSLPPAQWRPAIETVNAPYPKGPTRERQPRVTERPIDYGWTEILFSYVYAETVRIEESYPVQRNIEGERWAKYFICEAVGDTEVSSGHYRVYLPSWSAGSYDLQTDGRYGDKTRANPLAGGRRERIPPKMPLIGDANPRSERGDGIGDDECSYIDAGEANFAGSDGRANGNRFSDRHYGGTNYLFQDLHGAWKTKLREELARDYDLNGIIDIDVVP